MESPLMGEHQGSSIFMFNAHEIHDINIPHKMIFVLSKIILISKSTLNQPLSSVLINSVGVRHSLTLLQIRFVIHICDFKVIIMASESLLWPHRCILLHTKHHHFIELTAFDPQKKGFNIF